MSTAASDGGSSRENAREQAPADDRLEAALAHSEAKYRALFDAIDEGFCIIEMLFDAQGTPVDYRFLEVNAAFERQTGLADAVGRTVRALVPGHEAHWFAIYGRVALTGEATRFRNHAARLYRWYDVYAWRYGEAQDRQVAVLFNDVPARQLAEEALQESHRRKDAFLDTLAHELRTPLAPLRTGLDVLQVLRGDAAACEEPLRIMDRQLRHLTHLVDDLLDVSRISRGTLALRTERLDLAEIVDAALEMSRLGRGDRRLAVDVAPEPLPVQGDRVRLVQVVCNLLDNAAKFTEADGRITLRVARRADRAEIRVQDDGRGIPREHLASIFEMFSQTEPGRGGGLGIGLALVRSLVALHGGTVRADSEGPGRGALFTVSLPLDDAPPARPRPGEATDTDAPAKRRVLVVDDNPRHRRGPTHAPHAAEGRGAGRLRRGRGAARLRAVAADPHPDGSGHAGHGRLRGRPPAARRPPRARLPPGRHHRLGPGRGPAAHARSGFRRAPRQAGGCGGAEARPRRVGRAACRLSVAPSPGVVSDRRSAAPAVSAKPCGPAARGARASDWAWPVAAVRVP
jgi:signal transduction histidine kinase